jgi:hypothetical protein
VRSVIEFSRESVERGNPAIYDASAYENESKLERLPTSQFWSEIQDKIVVDFGCGEG